MFEAVVFPGQGSQRTGMGVDFAQVDKDARQIFDLADSVLPFKASEICRNDDPRLHLTEFTQPCILTAEIAMLAALRNREGFGATWFGGHSLGEYSALVAAGAIPFSIAVKLVHLRGQLMQRAVPEGVGAMAALMMRNLPFDQVQALANNHEVDIANDNSNDQVVLSGKKADVESACLALKSQFAGMRIVPLNVSAPFHSRHMREIERPFRDALESAKKDFDATKAICVASNYLGRFYSGELNELVDSLTHQISSRVRWRDNMDAILAKTKSILELGPSKPLRGFFKSVGCSIQAITGLAEIPLFHGHS